LKAVENWGMGGKQVRESNGRDWIDQSKVYTLRNPLNTDLDTNNERQECNIGTVSGE
jgi:hypothetical protein